MRTRAGRHTPRNSARRSAAAGGGDHTDPYANQYPDSYSNGYSDDCSNENTGEFRDGSAGDPDARRDAAGDGGSHRVGLRPRAGRRSAERIIGGSVVDALIARSRDRYAIADLESSTAELAIITAGSARRGRSRGSRPGRSAMGPAGRVPTGSARQRPRGRRQQLATLAIGAVTVVGLVAGVIAIVWSDPAPGSPPTVVAAGDPGAAPAAADQDLANAAEPGAGEPGPTGAAELDADSAAQNQVDASLGARDTESYLDGLRTVDFEVSDDGQAEQEAADAICEQLRRGVDRVAIERALPAMLPGVDRLQAPAVVDLAERYYCG